jgi:hypothetical protein
MGIYDSTESRSFNEAMNKLAGTNGVKYSEQWPMHVRNGAEYMREYHAHAGRVYAEELLHNRIGTSSVLALHMDHDDLNNQQRALLTCLADTVSNIDFDHMVRACMKGNALPTTAGMYFSKPEIPHSDLLHVDNEGLPPLAFTAPVLQDAVMHEAEPEVQLLAPAPVAEQLLAPAPGAEQLSPMISYAAQSPPRPPAVHVNPPGSASRTINLKGGAGKRRKTVKNAF